MRTFERSRGPVGPGTYFVKAQMLAVANGSGVTSSIQLDLSHMTVERISA